MSNLLNFKNVLLATVGALGSILAACLGGWTDATKTLFIFMAIDYITGIMVPLIFKESRKTEDGRYSSAVGFRGLAKKCVMILFVGAAYRVDILLGNGSFMFRDGVTTAFIVNELMSIIENARDMGVPIPDMILNMVSAIKENKSVSKTDMMIITALIASGALVIATPAKAAPMVLRIPEFGDIYADLYHPVNPIIATIEDKEKKEPVEMERKATEAECKEPEAERKAPEAEQDDEEEDQDCTHGVLLDVWDDGIEGGGICEKCGAEIRWEYLNDDSEEEPDEEDDIPIGSIWDGEEETEDDELS